MQYIYVDSNESTFAPNTNNNDVFIIGNQIPVTWKVDKDVTVKVAPGFTFYTGGGNTNYDGGVATNTGSTISGTTVGTAGTFFSILPTAQSIRCFTARVKQTTSQSSPHPGKLTSRWQASPSAPIGTSSSTRKARSACRTFTLQHSNFVTGFGTGVSARAARQNAALGDNVAWAAGLQIGVNKKKGDWSGLAEFRQIGLGAVDQNINGTDYADSYANQQGFKLSTVYNFTDFLTLTGTFYDTWDYKSNLYKSLGGTAATPNSLTASTLNLVGERSEQRLQVDLGWKF